MFYSYYSNFRFERDSGFGWGLFSLSEYGISSYKTKDGILLSNENKSEVIYHFTSASVALDKILLNSTLRFGPLIKTNDPKEVGTWKPVIKLTGSLRNFSPDDLIEKFNEVKSRAFLLCFSENRKKEDVPKCMSFSLESSFRRYVVGYNRPRMWAQYAENHTGLCIGLNKTKVVTKVREELGEVGEIIADSVEYGNFIQNKSAPFTLDLKEIEQGGTEAFKSHQNKYMKNLYFEKELDWRDETEYRILFLPKEELEQKTEVFIDVQDCIEEIIVGVNFSEKSILKLKKLKKDKYPKVSLQQIMYHNGDPYLLKL